jgi:transposase-like protein
MGHVTQDGDVLDLLVQSNRDKKAAKKFFFRKLLKGLRYVPHVIITDRLRSYGAAKAEVASIEHCQDKGQNNTLTRVSSVMVILNPAQFAVRGQQTEGQIVVDLLLVTP